MLNPEEGVRRNRLSGMHRPSPLSLPGKAGIEDRTSTPISSPYSSGLRFADSPNFEKMMEDAIDMQSAAGGRELDSPTLQSLPPDMVMALKQLWESRSEQEDHLTDRLDRTTVAWEEKQLEWEQKEAEHSDFLTIAQAKIDELERDKRELIEGQAQSKRVMVEQLDTALAESEGEMAYYRKEIERLTAQLKVQRSEQEVLEEKVVGLEELTDALETRAIDAEEACKTFGAAEELEPQPILPVEGFTTIATDGLAAIRDHIVTLEQEVGRVNDCLDLEREQHQHSLDAMTVALRSSQARSEAADETEEHLRSRLAEQAAEIAGLENRQTGEEACLTCQLQAAQTKQVAQTILEQMEAQAKIVEDELLGLAAKEVKIAGLRNEVRWLREEIKEQRNEYESLINSTQTSAAKLTQTYATEANSLRAQLVKLIDLLKGQNQVRTGDITAALRQGKGQVTVKKVAAEASPPKTPEAASHNTVSENDIFSV